MFYIVGYINPTYTIKNIAKGKAILFFLMELIKILKVKILGTIIPKNISGILNKTILS